MKVSAINLVSPRKVLKNNNVKQPVRNEIPNEQIQGDVVAFKGVKNAARMGLLYAIGGAFVGAIAMPALGILAGAATLGGIVGAVGAVAGAMESDKENILKK